MFVTHLLFSIFLGLLFFRDIGLTLSVIAGGILPDVDVGGSWIDRKIKVISLFFKHRGIFHSAWMALLFSLVIWFFFSHKLSLAFLLGYVGHVFIDGLTKQGVIPFYPLKFRMNGIIKTNSIFEKVLSCVLLISVCLLFYKIYIVVY